MQNWPADQVARRPVAELTPYARNARTHSDAQVGQIAASIREWGWTQPVLVDEGGSIIAGHGRVLAAGRLGIGEVPVIVARGWSEAQKRAYVIADNKLTENAGWDQEMLGIEISDLASADFNLDLIGFSEADLAKLLGSNPGLTDPDAAPELPVTPVTQAGEVWQLGRHRLVCGDATKAEDVAKALAGVQPHLMVTDPPYGVNYDPAWRNDPNLRGIIHGGGRADGPVMNDDRSDWSEAWALFGGEVAYCWCGQIQVISMGLQLQAADFELRNLIVWAKDNHVLTRGHYHSQQETCWYGVKKGKTAHWYGDRSQTTLWKVTRTISNETGHSTQKPVDCMKRPIENNSSPGQAIYDPFVGSGTTIIAAEMTARACHALEINPAYVDCAIMRWQNFTGQIAKLESTDQSFAELAECRKSVDTAKKLNQSMNSGSISAASTQLDAKHAMV
jgi:DNA modification methylase